MADIIICQAYTSKTGSNGSDTWLDNETSITAHKQLGYVEIERLVHFAKKL